jgi:hypothetical protein
LVRFKKRAKKHNINVFGEFLIKAAFCDFAVLGQVLGCTWPMPAITSSTTTATGGQLENVKKRFRYDIFPYFRYD